MAPPPLPPPPPQPNFLDYNSHKELYYDSLKNAERERAELLTYEEELLAKLREEAKLDIASLVSEHSFKRPDRINLVEKCPLGSNEETVADLWQWHRERIMIHARDLKDLLKALDKINEAQATKLGMTKLGRSIISTLQQEVHRADLERKLDAVWPTFEIKPPVPRKLINDLENQEDGEREEMVRCFKNERGRLKRLRAVMLRVYHHLHYYHGEYCDEHSLPEEFLAQVRRDTAVSEDG